MRFLAALLLTLWTTVASAAIAVTDLGSTSGASGSTLSLTLPTTVPAGSTIVVVVYEYTSAASVGSVSDQVSNSYKGLGAPGYSISPDNNVNFGYASLTYAYNVTSLPGGDTITFTRTASGSTATMNAFYLTGTTKTDPIDNAVIPSATFGLSSTPSITSGAPSVPNELIVSFVAAAYAGTILWTQDSTHAAYATPPDSVHLGSASTFGGNVVSSSALTYSPSMSVSTYWGQRVFGFKPKPSGAFVFTPAVVP